MLPPDGVLRQADWLPASLVEHGFTTKRSYQKGDRLDALATRLGLQRFQIAALKQVHGNHVVVVHDQVGRVQEGDALVTSTPGILLTIATADCLPVLLYAAEPHPCVAAIHCGWRGLRARVIDESLSVMRAEFGVVPDAISACLGPAIEMRCYEVGPDVRVPFAERSMARQGDRLRLDLAAEARLQLEVAGVAGERIQGLGLCTKCHPELFYSYRRDGPRTGRMINFIGLTVP